MCIAAVIRAAGHQAELAANTTVIPEPPAAPITIVSAVNTTADIDGKRLGVTPLANHQLSIGGMYRIRVEKTGYRTKRDSVRVRDETPISRRYILSRTSK